MLNEMWGAYGSNLTLAIFGVAAGFICLILVLWLIRGRGGPSPFLRGGKNRQPRLQVLDAAAVDARRRLVLVRRDDVEHLIMIGGPTDVVIESSIVDGRSPPYHTMMKTVSEPEQTAISADRQARVSEQAPRPAEFSAPAARVVPPAEKPENARQSEENGNFAWLGSEPVELSPAAKTAEPVRAAAPVQPPARNPEPPKPAEVATAPMQSVPAPKPAEITPPAETRAAEIKPVIDFPTIEPRATAAAAANPAPVVPAFSASSAAVAIAPAVAAPIAVKADPAPVVRIDEALAEARTDVDREVSRDVTKAAEPAFENEKPSAEHEAPSLDNAVDLLDAARERVFQQSRPEIAAQAAPSVTAPQAPAATPVQRPVPAVVQVPVSQIPMQQPASGSAPAKPLGSDFERILEEEMATNLAGGNAAPAVGPATSNAPVSQLPRRDPTLARVTGATQEPALQNEIARIFGEMSVTKDDR